MPLNWYLTAEIMLWITELIINTAIENMKTLTCQDKLILLKTHCEMTHLQHVKE